MTKKGAGDQPLYIAVRRWRDFQHYKDRNPPWIKNNTELLHKEEYLRLPGDTRAILHGLWLEYASAHAQLHLNTRSLSYRLRLRVTMPQLKRLEQEGWIEFTLAPRYQDASASRARVDEETETEEETEQMQEQLPASQAVTSNDGNGLAPITPEMLAILGQAGTDEPHKEEEPDLWST